MTPYTIQTASGLNLLCPAFTLSGLYVREQDPALQAEIAALGADYRTRFGELEISEIPGIQPVRATYRALGLDPTRYRPSSEALLRRVLKGQDLYRINTLVDALNLCSLRFLVPFGLYDLDQIKPPVALKLGAAGEGYPGIRKEFINVEDRYCLADQSGPFGNPSADSDRTKITLATRNALVAAFLPLETEPSRVSEILDETEKALLKYSSAQ
jgi:DNA/RNA-binding domain of Phe-tRNA-synthetase-like protein